MPESSKLQLVERSVRLGGETARVLARGALWGIKETADIGLSTGWQVLQKTGLVLETPRVPDRYAVRQQLIENELAEHGQDMLRQRQYERIDAMFLQLVRIIRRRAEEPEPIVECIQDAAFVLQNTGIDEPTIGVAVRKAYDWAGETELLKVGPDEDVALPSMTHLPDRDGVLAQLLCFP